MFVCCLDLLFLALLAGCGGATATPEVPTATPAGVSLAGLLPTPTPVQLAPGEIPQGGAWRRAIALDPVSFNPILAADPASAAVQALIFPTLLSQDPMTGQYTTDGGMAERWEVAADSRTYTFFLRPGVTWSDGDPVDAADFKFTYDAIAEPTVDSPFKRNLEAIDAIEVLDPLTLRVTFKEVKCDGLADLQVGWLPSHFFLADPEFEFGDLVDNPFNDRPQISAGPFVLQSWTPGDNVVLTRNQRYWRGPPHMDRLIFRIVADPAERIGAAARRRARRDAAGAGSTAGRRAESRRAGRALRRGRLRLPGAQPGRPGEPAAGSERQRVGPGADPPSHPGRSWLCAPPSPMRWTTRPSSIRSISSRPIPWR